MTDPSQEPNEVSSPSDDEQSASPRYAQPPLDTPEQRAAAVEMAFDYRGDVTIETDDGHEVVGYVFDRRGKGDDGQLRLLTADSDKPVTLRYAQISRLTLSGRDPAAGQSWETWVRQYAERKARGEPANREPQPLDEEE